MTSEQRLRKTTKIAFSILCLTGFVWQFSLFLVSFLKFPTTTDITIGEEDTLEFPAVTVCHYNKLRKFFVQEHWPDINSENLTDAKKQNLMWKLLRTDRRKYFNLTYAQQLDAGHQAYSMIFSQYSYPKNKSICDKWNPVPFYKLSVYSQGPCFTCNPMKVPGLSNSIRELWIILDLQPQEILLGKVEAKIIMHQKNYIPDVVAEEGVRIEPGIEYDIKLQQSTTLMLSEPYGNKCYHEEKQQYVAKEICTSLCIQKELINICSCMTENWWTSSDVISSLCDTSVRQVCERTPRISLLKKQCRSNCLLPCKKVLYGINVLKSDWPNMDRTYWFHGDVEAKYEGWTTITWKHDEKFKTLTERKKSLARARIHFDSNVQVIYAQSSKYESIELFSYLGGYLGTWLGISLLTILDLIFDSVNKFSEKKKPETPKMAPRERISVLVHPAE